MPIKTVIRMKKRSPTTVDGRWLNAGEVVEVPTPRALFLLQNGYADRMDPIEAMGARNTSMRVEETRRKELARIAGGFPQRFEDPGPAWVVIPTHNRPDRLRNALRSVEAQDPRPEAVVVVDDGSDDPAAVADACRTMGLNVKLVRLDTCSGGPNAPRIRGMEELPKHCMVVELDDHDWLQPGAIAAMREAMLGGASFVYGDCVYFGMGLPYPPPWFTEQDNLTGPNWNSGVWRHWRKPGYHRWRMRDRVCEVSGTRAYRRELYDFVGGWRPEECPAGDAALFLRFEMVTGGGEGITKLDRILTWNAMDPSGLSTRLSENQGSNFLRYQRAARTGELIFGTPAEPPWRSYGNGKLRVGIWQTTSECYSGGRIHLWQYGYALAQAGAELFIITNRQPIWISDYPECKRVHVLTEHDDIPEDIDIVVSDAKDRYGELAAKYAEERGRPFIGINFETPNWVEKFIPEIARQLERNLDVMHKADGWISISGESERHLREFLGYDDSFPMTKVPPAVNTYALAKSEHGEMDLPDRPYAVWSARSSPYKGAAVAMRAVWELDVPFDLVCLGYPSVSNAPKENDLHRMHVLTDEPDWKKFKAMRGAHLTLAPSKFEGYGMVPAESMCAGTPAVVYDLPVMREEYGDVLVYVPWGDEEAYCAKVKELVAKPKLKVDSKAAIAKHGMANMIKWVEKMPRHVITRPVVTAQLICYRTPSAVEALRAVYPHVDQVTIAYGPVELYPDWGGEDPVLRGLRNFPDPDGKIVIEDRRTWKDKLEMRAWCASVTTGNRVLVFDADEIYVGLENLLRADPQRARIRFVHFWRGLGHHIVDPNTVGHPVHWGREVEPFGVDIGAYRWSHWRPSYKWVRHVCPGDASGDSLMRGCKTVAEDVVIYHLGHAIPRRLWEAKHRFYQNREGSPSDELRMWGDWDGQVGRWYDGVVKRVDFAVPPVVRNAYEVMCGEGVQVG